MIVHHGRGIAQRRAEASKPQGTRGAVLTHWKALRHDSGYMAYCRHVLAMRRPKVTCAGRQDYV